MAKTIGLVFHQSTSDKEISLDKLTRAELDALAAEKGLDTSKCGTKAEVLVLLGAASGTTD